MRTKNKTIIINFDKKKGEIKKKNKTFIKDLRKKTYNNKIKLKISIHDQINFNMLKFSTWFFIYKNCK